MVALGCIIYIAYWAVLLVPIQEQWAGSGQYPDLVICLIAAVGAGAIFASCTYVGNAFTKNKSFGVKHTRYSFDDLVKSKAFLWWLAITVGLTIAGTILWRGDL